MNEMLDAPASNDIDVDDGPDHLQTDEYKKDNGSHQPDGTHKPKRMDPRLFWVVFPVLCIVIAVFAVITVGVFASLVFEYFTNSTMATEQGVRNALGLGLLPFSTTASIFSFEFARQLWTDNIGEKGPASAASDEKPAPGD